jgi:hypothetical protein
VNWFLGLLCAGSCLKRVTKPTFFIGLFAGFDGDGRLGHFRFTPVGLNFGMSSISLHIFGSNGVNFGVDRGLLVLFCAGRGHSCPWGRQYRTLNYYAFGDVLLFHESLLTMIFQQRRSASQLQIEMTQSEKRLVIAILTLSNGNNVF